MAKSEHTGTWVSYSGGEASAIAVRRCRLTVTRGPDAGLSREFAARSIRVGARQADLALADPEVSGAHFELIGDASGYRIRDLDSTNGTFIGGLRVFEVGVSSGVEIAVGSSAVLFETLDDAVEMPLYDGERFGEMIGRSPVMRELFARLVRVAATDATVILTGETGTGKDTAAESIHLSSPRASGPFVVLDCGAIPPNLIESEIFGHVRGAFTGATADVAGAFERGHGGTLFLDEIGELPLELQPKLLRALERREIRRIGSAERRAVDVRVIAATNRDLASEVNRGRFREDLYYRLAVATVEIPPLRDHREDIELLVDHFLANIPGGEQVAIRPKTLAAMARHDWPGNIRELRNVIERAVLLREQPTSATSLRRAAPRKRGDATSPVEPDEPGGDAIRVEVDLAIPLKQAKQALIDEFETRYVSALLEAHEYNLSAAARASGTNRMTLHKIAERLGLRKKK